MNASAVQSPGESGIDPRSARAQAEAAFHLYLDRSRAGDPPQIASLLQALPAEVRTELELIFDDYLALRGSSVPQAMQLSPGTVLSGFELVREVGRGGMGCIWEAQQRFPRRLVALKILYPHLSLFDHSLERFHKEAEACAVLRHEHIVAVHGVGEHGGVHWIAMELVPGGLSLADRIAELRQRPVLPADHWKRVARIVRKVAAALWAAHEAGIVHRDIKPGNILLTPDGNPKVADFGLARMQDDLSKSRSGRLSGTPYYMSPEQAASSRLGVDARTDIYSLGVTLYEAACLERPYEAATQPELLERILLGDTPDPRLVRRDMPRDLAAIVMKMMAKRREARYATMAAVIDDLDRFVAGERVSARLPSVLARTASALRARRALASGVAVGVFGLGAASLVYLRTVEARDRTERSLEQALELVGRREVSGGVVDSEATGRVAASLEEQARDEGDPSKRFGLRLNAGLLRLSAEQLGEASVDLEHARELLPVAAVSPEEEYQLHDARARSFAARDSHDQRVEALLAAGAVARANFAKDDVRLARTMAQLATAYLRDGRMQDAQDLVGPADGIRLRLEKGIAAGARRPGGDRLEDAEALLLCAELLWRRGRREELAEARGRQERAVELLRRLRGANSFATMSAELGLLQIASESATESQARALLVELDELERRHPAARDSLLGSRWQAQRSRLLAAAGDPAGAALACASALPELEFWMGSAHPEVLELRRVQCSVLVAAGRCAAAFDALVEAHALHERRYGAADARTAQLAAALDAAKRRLESGC